MAKHIIYANKEEMDALRAESERLQADAARAKERRIMRQTYLYHCMNLVDFINGAKICEGMGACEDTIMGDVDRAKGVVKRLRGNKAKLREAIESLPCVCVSDVPCYRCVVLVETRAAAAEAARKGETSG